MPPSTAGCSISKFWQLKTSVCTTKKRLHSPQRDVRKSPLTSHSARWRGLRGSGGRAASRGGGPQEAPGGDSGGGCSPAPSRPANPGLGSAAAARSPPGVRTQTRCIVGSQPEAEPRLTPGGRGSRASPEPRGGGAAGPARGAARPGPPLGASPAS